MRYLKCILNYKGTRYFGFQRQRSTPLTIQGIVEGVLTTLLGHRVLIDPASRTDAGVHALGQVINFSTKRCFPIQRLKYAANCLLPPDIRIIDIEETEASFHSRFSAIARQYTYLVLNTPTADPFIMDYCYWIYSRLDIDAMRKAASFLVGEKNFQSFSIKSDSQNPVRHLYKLDIDLMENQNISNSFPFFKEGILVFNFIGDSFLRGMIRKIMGTLLRVGFGNLKPDDMLEIIESKNNLLSGSVLAPNGLFLVRVFYDKNSFEEFLKVN